MAFLGKGKKQDMLQLAEELGINATLNMTVSSIKIAITNSEGYEEEFVKNLYETIIANGKRLEELERAETMRLEEELERAEKIRLEEELERAEKIRLEELVKEQALKEKELQLKFDLESLLNAVQTRSQVKAAREERGIDSGDAKKGEDEARIVSSDAEDEILIPALQEYVPELALLRVTRENLINAQKNREEIKSLYEQAASQVQVTNQVYSLEKELLVKNREDKLGNVVKLIVVPEGLRDPIKSLCHEETSEPGNYEIQRQIKPIFLLAELL
ncbi:hypothetical protein TNCV_3021211 [Trichonephila clavipes]|nr:hypothetical protein TNCV_3021211 [Trichonephila clavipes]